MSIDQNKHPSGAIYTPGPFDWEALTVLALSLRGGFTVGRELQLRKSLSLCDFAHLQGIAPDDKSDNLLIDFFVEGLSRQEAFTRAVGAIFVSLAEGNPDESDFVAMQLAGELEIEANGAEILYDSEHDVSIEAHDLLQDLLQDRRFINHLKAS